MLSCQRRITLQLISHLDTHSLMPLQIISKVPLPLFETGSVEEPMALLLRLRKSLILELRLC
jgi:hypothetical protein